MGALIQLLQSPGGVNFRDQPIYTFLGAVAAWIVAEIYSDFAARGPHSHDVELLKKFREKLPPPTLTLLQQHNFGAPINRHAFDPFDDIADEWKGVNHEFVDTALQRRFKKVLETNEEFTELLASSLYASRANPNVLTPKTDRDLAHGVSDATRERINAMNEKAKELLGTVEAFEREARLRIR